MAGMNPNQQLIDHALGYDDNYHSTEDSRNMYWCVFNADHARPHWVMQLSSGPRVFMRPPANEGEYLVQKIVEAAFKRMMF